MIKPPFEEMIPAAMVEINKRRNGWTLTSVPFDDVIQLLLIRANDKYNQFIPEKGPFANWLNTLISNALTNILRDNLGKFSPPCNTGKGGCEFNRGEDLCGFTKSGHKDCECPAYCRWLKKKRYEYGIKQGLSLDSHSQEVNTIPDEFIDIAEYKTAIDLKMVDHLTVQELRIYKLLFNEHKTMAEVGVILKLAKAKNSPIAGYQTIHKAKQKIIKIAKKIITEDII